MASTTQTARPWVYNGDVNLEHGGNYIDLSTWDDGYCNAVRVTDLDSACGFTGACMIEHVTVNIPTAKRIREALQCCGGQSWLADCGRNVPTADRRNVLRHAVADALLWYGCYEQDDEAGSETVQMESDGPMRHDGMRANKRLHNTDLRKYVESQHLNG